MWPFAERLAARLRARLAKRALRGCNAVGDGVRIAGHVDVESRGCIEIGSGFEMSSVPVRSHLVAGPGGRLRIGDRVTIAHGASVFAHTSVEIGDGTTIGPMAMILDVDFHEINDRESKGSARPIRIGRNVRIGSGVVILRGVTIGDGARIAPNSVVSRVIPPGAVAAGVPARPVARNDASSVTDS